MSFYDFVGHVLKYFGRGKQQVEKKQVSHNEKQELRHTPPREHQRRDSHDEKEVWKTPESYPRRQNPGMMPMDSRMFYSLSGAGDYLRPMEYSWPEFPASNGVSESQYCAADSGDSVLRPLLTTPPRAPLRSCLKRSQSLSLTPPPLLLRQRTEWKSKYDSFQPLATIKEEGPKRTLSSRLPVSSYRNVSLEDTRHGATKTLTHCCPCRAAREFCGAEVARRSQLNARLERMFRMVSKSRYCGNIIDAASHARWMRLAGVDEDAALFKKFTRGRVVLTVSQYKIALQKICEVNGLDYWDVLSRMTADSNFNVSA